MQYLENIITPEEIEIFKTYWETNKDQSYLNGTVGDNNPAKEFTKNQDRRLLIVERTKTYAIVRRIVDSLFPAGTHFWANYQQQTAPPQLHVDEYGFNRNNPTYTIVIAVDTVPEFKAIVFKELANDCGEAWNIISQRIETGVPRFSNISETEALDHSFYGELTVNGNRISANACDWLTLDGIFEYKAGCGCLFDTNQLHITNYWRRYPQFQTRDLIQIHIGTPTVITDVAEKRRNADPIPDVRDVKVIG